MVIIWLLATTVVASPPSIFVDTIRIQYTHRTIPPDASPVEVGVDRRWHVFCREDFLQKINVTGVELPKILGCIEDNGVSPCRIVNAEMFAIMNPREDSDRARPFPYGLPPRPPGFSFSCLPFVANGPAPCHSQQNGSVTSFPVARPCFASKPSANDTRDIESWEDAIRRTCTQLVDGHIIPVLHSPTDWSESCDPNSPLVQPCFTSGKDSNTTQFIVGPTQRVPYNLDDISTCVRHSDWFYANCPNVSSADQCRRFEDGEVNCPYSKDPDWLPKVMRVLSEMTPRRWEVRMPTSEQQCQEDFGHLGDTLNAALRHSLETFLAHWSTYKKILHVRGPE